MNNILSVTPYDPRTPRDFSPLTLGGYIVYRRRLQGTPFTRYCIMANGALVGYQTSYPTESDCRALERTAVVLHRVRPDITPVYDQDSGTLTDRIIVLLKLERMQLAELSSTLKRDPNILSPILGRLTKEDRVRRSGRPGNYTYSA